jgi:DNA-binding transcriptional MerR regulator
MGSHQPIRKIVTPEIPDKLYFRIGDVAKLCDVPAYVLRFWETEFPQLKPNKGGTGQRLYRKRDVEMALRVKSLLYDQGFTIPGARQILKSDNKGASEAVPFEAPPPEPRPVEMRSPVSDSHRDNQLQSIRNEMNAVLGILSRPVSSAAQPAPTGIAKVKTMRPRLVLEPRPTPIAVERPRLQLEQRDLFGGDFNQAPESAE